MQGLNNQNEPRNNNTNNNKKILIIICIYLFLTLTSKYSKNQANAQMRIINKLLTGATQISVSDAISAFELEEIYIGTWADFSKQPNLNNILDQNKGKFEMKATHVVNFNGGQRYVLQFNMYNGGYIDNGVLSFAFFIEDSNFTSSKENQTLVYFLNSTSEILAQYNIQQIMIKVEGGETKLQKAALSFSLTQKSTLKTNIDINILNRDFSFNVHGRQNRLLKIMAFAAILFLVSFSSFSSIMKILRSLYELQDNARNYSLVTICLTCMWDATLCVLAFIFAFNDQESLMLFIMPAFLLCLLFTNLQPRFMILIYQQSTNAGIREIICKFNLFHYGSLFMVYPILLFTNMNWVLFIGMSLIYFPQIYLNGINGIRPQISSHYYTRYLLTRLIIIIYLRCFPYNIFDLQPNYILTVFCFLIVGLQYGLLYVQKRYGSKKVIPSFLLQPVFNYKLQEQINVEEGVQSNECSICLTSLSTEPLHDANQLQFEPPFKLMNTPCKHKYHSRCLMLWMKVKMQCPQCRFKLPPYE